MKTAAQARRNLNGWLVVDKRPGMSSAAVVGAVRRLTCAAKAGHSGTLDPLATGVLPLALGEATKTVSYVMDGLKRYRFTVRWGLATDTDDAEGSIIAETVARPDHRDIEATLHRFIGEIWQTPPAFSAIKIDGRRAYQLARENAPVALQSRSALVKEFRLIAMPDQDHSIFETTSGKGVYMRALARDLAEALGTRGHITALRRLSAGPFQVEQSVTLDQLAAIVSDGGLDTVLLSVGAALADVPALPITAIEAGHLRNGRPIAILPLTSRLIRCDLGQDKVVYATERGRPVALAKIRGGELRPLRVLNV